MTEIVAPSIDPSETQAPPVASSQEYVRGLQMVALCMVLLLINAFSQIDRILPFIALFVPGMLSFSFMPPRGFGAAHLIAGPGRQAQATSLVMIGSGLAGPALGPLIVGIVSDAATAADIPNGLALGLLIVPLASVMAGIVYLIANQKVANFLRQR